MGLVNEAGIIVEEQEGIKNVVVSYCKGLFAATRPLQRYETIFQNANFSLLLEDQAVEISKPFETHEIVSVLKGTHPAKAPVQMVCMHYFKKILKYWGR